MNSAEIQATRDGPLSKAFRERINAVRAQGRLSLADIGARFGISGPYLSTLLREKDPGRVRTIHIQRFHSALQQLEGEIGLGPAPGGHGLQQEHGAVNLSTLSIEDLIRAAHERGFSVTFHPLNRAN